MAKQKKMVVIETSGPIAQLGGIAGPILNPTPLDVDTIYKIVATHKKVVEVNPDNFEDRVVLTLKTVNTNNFKGQVTHVPAPAAAVPTQAVISSDFAKM